MSADLEETLAELGPDYRKVVDRLRAPFAGDEGRVDAAHEARGARRIGFLGPVATLLAASLAVAFAWHFLSAPADAVAPGEPADGGRIAARGVEHGEQRRLHAHHAARGDRDALRVQILAVVLFPGSDVGVYKLRVALRKAVRSKGLSPLSDAELRSRAAQASVQG